MAFIFPDDKNDFKAPNGVTYSWDGTKWVTKTYNGAEADVRLPYRLGTDKAARSARSGEPAVELVDAEDNFSNVKFFGEKGISCSSNIQGILVSGDQLQQQIDELGVTKGSVARYAIKDTSFAVAARNGELYVSAPAAADVQTISFAPFDLNGQPIKPCHEGDIIEFVETVSAASTGEVSRYRIISGNSNALSVEYLSGQNDFVVDEVEEVYIYPQNSSGGGGIPVGSIMMWINSKPPVGWFKLKGESFDVTQYPLLHAYLEASKGSVYTSGKLPDWRGHYPGQLGDHLNGDVGIKLGQRTAKPNMGSPYSSKSIPQGNTRTFNAGGGTNAYSDGVARPSIDSGWDDVTRPKTVAVHFIIKHD